MSPATVVLPAAPGARRPVVFSLILHSLLPRARRGGRRGLTPLRTEGRSGYPLRDFATGIQISLR